ncbi:MAG: mechanosensitive ion channel family protein [Planctomycetes bacterium]|nr:mechanosensitive ion channel family protein [Planctomycetota bacterium]
MSIDEATLHWLKWPIAGNPAWLWISASALFLAVLAAFLLARRLIASGSKPRGDGTPAGPFSIVAAVLARTHVLFLASMAFLIGSLVVDLGDRALLLRRCLVVVALVQAGIWGTALLGAVLHRWRDSRAKDGTAVTALAAAETVGRIALWVLVFVLALDNLGVKVTALMAGLGIGGIAIALAAQSVLGDLFASFSILLDRPFEVGDFVVVGELQGTIENIGIKSTRIRSLSGEQIVISNADLLASRIRNFRRMSERRVAFGFSVDYRTPPEKIAAIPAILREIVEAEGKPRVRFDRAHLQKLGDFGLVFEVAYFVTEPDYNCYMDIQQAINLAIHRNFAGMEIVFASPQGLVRT